MGLHIWVQSAADSMQQRRTPSHRSCVSFVVLQLLDDSKDDREGINRFVMYSGLQKPTGTACTGFTPHRKLTTFSKQELYGHSPQGRSCRHRLTSENSVAVVYSWHHGSRSQSGSLVRSQPMLTTKWAQTA